MTKLQQHKEQIEQALGLKFKKGRDTDWGGAEIMPIKGDNYNGMFLCDISPLTGEQKIILMVRIHNSETGLEEDTEVLIFDAEVDDIDLFIRKLEWV